MSVGPRLSVAVTPKLSPPARCWVSAAVVSRMLGGTGSRTIWPGLRDVSHAPTAPTSAHIPHSSPALRPCRIRGSRLLPGVGRHQVVDDVWRDQNQEIAPVLVLLAESEQLANDRQVYKERDSGLAYRDRGHREAADDRRLAVVDEDLVVGLLGLEREADVHRRRLHGG